MAFSTSSVQPASKPVTEKKLDNNTIAASLLSLLLLSVYAAKKSKRALRQMKRRLLWNAFKLKLKSMFSKKADVSDRTLLLILFVVLIVALLLINVVVGLVVLLFLLLLYLLGVLKF